MRWPRPATKVPWPRRIVEGNTGLTVTLITGAVWCRTPGPHPFRRYERPLAERRLPGGPNDATAARASPLAAVVHHVHHQAFPTAGDGSRNDRWNLPHPTRWPSSNANWN